MAVSEVILALVMGMSLMGVARSSELRFAQSEQLKKKVDIHCLRSIVFGITLSMLIGGLSFMYIKYYDNELWIFRRVLLQILFVGSPFSALCIYFLYYRKFLPFARSIEQARGSVVASAPVTRFQQLLFSRVALYLVCLETEQSKITFKKPSSSFHCNIIFVPFFHLLLVGTFCTVCITSAALKQLIRA